MGDALKKDQKITDTKGPITDLRDFSDICELNLSEYTTEQIEQALNEWDGDIENAPNPIKRLISENKDNALIQILLRNHESYLKQINELRQL